MSCSFPAWPEAYPGSSYSRVQKITSMRIRLDDPVFIADQKPLLTSIFVILNGRVDSCRLTKIQN